MSILKGNDFFMWTTHIAKTPSVADFELTLFLLCSLGTQEHTHTHTHTHSQIFDTIKEKL